jgi:hypothetical protein
MLKFEYNRSYLWLFRLYLILFFGGFALCAVVGHERWGVVALPAFVASLLLGELRSGVALDAWWRATYLKGSWQYPALIAWHATGVVASSILALFFVRWLSTRAVFHETVAANITCDPFLVRAPGW